MELLTIIFEALFLIFKIACVLLGLIIVIGIIAGGISDIIERVKLLNEEEQKAKLAEERRNKNKKDKK